MREYGTLAVNFWTEGKGRQLRGDLTALALAPYVFACPHGNMIGLFYLPIAYVSNDLNIPSEGALKGLRRLAEVDILTLDEGSDAVFVHGAARRNLGASLKPKDNRVKHVRDLLWNLRKHPFYGAFMQRYADALSVSDMVEPSPLEAPSKPLRSQEQEQEQEQLLGPCGATTTGLDLNPAPERRGRAVCKAFIEAGDSSWMGTYSGCPEVFNEVGQQCHLAKVSADEAAAKFWEIRAKFPEWHHVQPKQFAKLLGSIIADLKNPSKQTATASVPTEWVRPPAVDAAPPPADLLGRVNR